MRISGRVISDPPMPEAGPRELLGGDDHRPCTRRCRLRCKPPYSAGTLSPNAPSSARPVTISSGTSPLVRCTCSACGAMTSSGERPERVGDHVHLAVEMAGPGLIGERRRGTRDRGTAGRTSCACRSGSRSTPHIVLAAEDLRRQVVQHVGGEGAGDPRLEVALGAVVEQRPRGRDAGRGVGDVVGEHLGGVGSAELAASGGTPWSRSGRRGRSRRRRRVRRGRRARRRAAPRRLLRRSSRRRYWPVLACSFSGRDRCLRRCDDGQHRACSADRTAGATIAFSAAAIELGTSIAEWRASAGLRRWPRRADGGGRRRCARRRWGGGRRDHRAPRRGRGGAHRRDVRSRSPARCTSARRGWRSCPTA